MAVDSCPICATVRMPGSPWCTRCFAAFDEAPAEVAALAAPPAPRDATAPSRPVVDYGWAPAPSAASAPPPGAPAGWRPPSTGLDTVVVGARSGGAGHAKQIALLAVVGLLLILAVGALLVYRATPHGAKADFARAFRSARPPAFVPSMPDLASSLDLDDQPEAPGEAQQYLQGLDPGIRAMNERIVGMQKILDSWANGEIGDDVVRTEVDNLVLALKPLDSIGDQLEAPRSMRRGLGKLATATSNYDWALGSLLDWLDSGSSGAKVSFHLMVGQANASWDEGLLQVYRAGGMTPPALPHPQRKA